MKRLCLVGVALTVLGFAVPAMAAPISYQFQTIINPNDSTFTQLLGINDASTIAGYFGSGAAGHPNQGFTLTLPSSFTPENFPGSAQTQVVGINNLGNTAGFYITGGMTPTTNGFLDTGGVFSTVDAPATVFNQLLGLNNNGEAAGYSSAIDPAGMNGQEAYTEQGGTFTYLTSLLPSGTQNNQATGVNDSGEVSGFYVDSLGVTHGFLLNGSTLTTIDPTGSMFTQALGVNNLGQVSGVYIDSGMVQHGFLDINGTFQTIDDPAGFGTTTVNGLNNQDQLVGFYVDGNDNTDGFVASPTPEPGSLLLLSTGLAGFGAYRRRRQRG